MTQMQTQGPVVAVKPQPNVYTVLIIISAIALAVALIVMMYNLSANYGLDMGQIFGFSPVQVPGK